MAAFLAPIGNGYAFFTSQGVVLSGGKIQTYLAGTTTPATTFTDSTQVTPNPNPIILGSNGIVPQEIWLSSGVRYKFVILDSLNNVLVTYDNLSGINDVTATASQWISSGSTPTFLSGTSFSAPGDQTSIFTVYRRIQAFVNTGIVYGTVLSSVFSSGVTTVVLQMDSTALDNGLTVVNVGFLTSQNQSIPPNFVSIIPPANFLTGLVTSTVGGSAIITTSSGQAADSTNSYLITLSTSMPKTTSSWALGASSGALDTGVIAANTWYHWYLIRRPDTGVVDICCSLSATSPTFGVNIPSAYTQYRRYASAFTIAGVIWSKYVQINDTFLRDASILDVNANNPGTSAITRTLSVPIGIVVQALFIGGLNNTASSISSQVLFSPLVVSDQAPSATSAPLWSSGALAGNAVGGVSTSHVPQIIFTNTSAQIRTRLTASDANTTLYIATYGWIDIRGKI